MLLLFNQTEELLERIFTSTKDLCVMVLDFRMKVIKANKALLQLFEISDAPIEGSRLSDLHPFWGSAEIKKEISNIIINNQPLINREFLLETSKGTKKKVKFDSQIMESKAGMGRKIFIMIEDLS